MFDNVNIYKFKLYKVCEALYTLYLETPKPSTSSVVNVTDEAKTEE